MKITTRVGDCGKTYINGRFVYKSSKIAEAIGSLDMTITYLEEAYSKTKIEYLLETIKTLRRVGSDLGGYTKIDNDLYSKQTKRMDETIESIKYDIKKFITFVKDDAVALDKARAQVRELERKVVKKYRWRLNKPFGLFAYLNRLSDLLFAYAVEKEFSENL